MSSKCVHFFPQTIIIKQLLLILLNILIIFWFIVQVKFHGKNYFLIWFHHHMSACVVLMAQWRTTQKEETMCCTLYVSAGFNACAEPSADSLTTSVLHMELEREKQFSPFLQVCKLPQLFRCSLYFNNRVWQVKCTSTPRLLKACWERSPHQPQSQFTASPSHPVYCKKSLVYFLISRLKSNQSVSNIQGFEFQEKVFHVLFSNSCGMNHSTLTQSDMQNAFFYTRALFL